MFSNFKKYLFYSVIFHLGVLLFLVVGLKSDAPLPKPEPRITMLRLQPRLGSTSGAADKPAGEPKKGEPGTSGSEASKPAPKPEAAATPKPAPTKTAEKSPPAKTTSTPPAQKPKPVAAATPKAKSNPPPAKTAVKPVNNPKAVALKTTKNNPKTKAEKATAPQSSSKSVAKNTAKTKTNSTTTSTAKTSAKSGNDSANPSPATPGPEDEKISAALKEIGQQIDEREKSGGGGNGGGDGGGANPGKGQGGSGSQEAGLGSAEGKITARDPGYVGYQSKVRSNIIRNWVQTSTGDETQRLRARVLVRINTAGQVIGKSFVKSSGNPSFDNSVLRAVERASPFPSPPDSVRDEALREGFVVDFSARVLGKNN